MITGSTFLTRAHMRGQMYMPNLYVQNKKNPIKSQFESRFKKRNSLLEIDPKLTGVFQFLQNIF